VKRYLMVVAVLAVAGIIVAGLLTSFHFSTAAAGRFCSTAGGCDAVNSSRFSRIGPVPVAVLGLAGYVCVLLLALVGPRIPALRDGVPIAVFGISLIGVLYSAYLTYLELFVIHAICPWCVLSAVLMTAILVASIVQISRGGAKPDRRRSA
jgi:uncharacterized membrane protein